jgi:hypothetical protein
MHVDIPRSIYRRISIDKYWHTSNDTYRYVSNSTHQYISNDIYISIYLDISNDTYRCISIDTFRHISIDLYRYIPTDISRTISRTIYIYRYISIYAYRYISKKIIDIYWTMHVDMSIIHIYVSKSVCRCVCLCPPVSLIWMKFLERGEMMCGTSVLEFLSHGFNHLCKESGRIFLPELPVYWVH